jgi:hypothetical protein
MLGCPTVGRDISQLIEGSNQMRLCHEQEAVNAQESRFRDRVQQMQSRFLSHLRWHCYLIVYVVIKSKKAPMICHKVTAATEH